MKIKTKATLLLAVLILTTLTIATASAAETLYVDDDGVEYPTPDYNTIQEAIAVAGIDDTILVYPGTYLEDVYIDVDGLTLESTEKHGANIQGTVIIGGNLLTVDGVSVVDFKITDFSDIGPTRNAIWLIGTVTDILIEGNLIDGSAVWPENRATGIESTANSAGNAEIIGNEILNVRMGIYYNPLFSSEITENTIAAVKCIGTESPVIAHYNNFYALPDNLKGMAPGFGVEAFGVTVDATLNWWGVTFPTEIKDMVSGEVDFTPWLSAPIGKDYEPVSENPKLDSEYYVRGDTVIVTVYDWSKNIDPMALQKVSVKAKSTIDLIGDTNIVLTETGADKGIFKGSFTLISEPPANRGANEVVASEDDTITVTYLGYPSVEAYVDEVPPEFAEVIGDDYYANTYTIELVANLGEPDLTVTADFSAIDSEYDLLEVTVSDPIEGKYTINYVITEENTRPDGEYTIPIEAEDGAENSDIYNFVTTLDNSAPIVTEMNADPSVIQPDTSSLVAFTVDVSDEFSGVESVTIDLTEIEGDVDQDMAEITENIEGEEVGTGVYKYTWAGTVALGDNYDLTITATDILGNENVAEAITLKVIADLDAPIFVSADVTYPTGVDSARTNDPVLVTVVATDDLSEVATITIDATNIGLSETEPMTPDADTWTATLTVGVVEPGTYELTLTATDFATNTATETVTVEITTDLTGLYVDLEEGWNLFSLPLIPDDSSIEVVLADVMENVEIVWGYKEDVWSSYMPDLIEFSTLTELVDGEGYWVLMTTENTVTVSGVELPGPGVLPPVYDVVIGWNMIGFKSVNPMNPDVYLTTIPETVQESSICYGWNAIVQDYEMAYIGGTETDNFYPGQGYWLYITEDATIAPPTEDPLL